MSDTVIKVENLSKQYRIGAREPGYRTFRETIVDAVKAPFQGIVKLFSRQSSIVNRQSEETIWALRNVSFEVKRGEVVGIIGRNGAGKSTLLKILSKITEPTEGRVELRGRIGSLLEVGTGFHPELTGHENVYLYGAILGMDRWEITRKFDEIIAFAEIEKFIDTPVKKYSSGMYMRLAFAVAAHLEPEILLVDEVLAVGDAAFQKKCLGKMGDISKEGRTVLFVSHNMSAIARLCEYCILLESGQVEKKGLPTEVIEIYISKDINLNQAERSWDLHERVGDESCRLIGVRVCQPSGVPNSSIDITKPFEIEIETQSDKIEIDLAISIQIFTVDGRIALHTADITNSEIIGREPGRRVSCCQFPEQLLNTGTYFLTVGSDIPNKRMIFLVENILSFYVQNPSPEMGKYGSSAWKGVIGPGMARWLLKT
jgi:lipopolysaccharide transport system ATP-binding protein